MEFLLFFLTRTPLCETIVTKRNLFEYKCVYDETNNGLDICLICWTPTKPDNHLKKLSDFSHINVFCNCQPKIHYLCLNNWITKNSSCPICRKKITLKISKKTTIIEMYYFYEEKYHICFYKSICFLSFIYFTFAFLYNIYFFYHIYHYEYDYIADL